MVERGRAFGLVVRSYFQAGDGVAGGALVRCVGDEIGADKSCPVPVLCEHGVQMDARLLPLLRNEIGQTRVLNLVIYNETAYPAAVGGATIHVQAVMPRILITKSTIYGEELAVPTGVHLGKDLVREQ